MEAFENNLSPITAKGDTPNLSPEEIISDITKQKDESKIFEIRDCGKKRECSVKVQKHPSFDQRGKNQSQLAYIKLKIQQLEAAGSDEKLKRQKNSQSVAHSPKVSNFLQDQKPLLQTQIQNLQNQNTKTNFENPEGKLCLPLQTPTQEKPSKKQPSNLKTNRKSKDPQKNSRLSMSEKELRTIEEAFMQELLMEEKNIIEKFHSNTAKHSSSHCFEQRRFQQFKGVKVVEEEEGQSGTSSSFGQQQQQQQRQLAELGSLKSGGVEGQEELVIEDIQSVILEEEEEEGEGEPRDEGEDSPKSLAMLGFINKSTLQQEKDELKQSFRAMAQETGEQTPERKNNLSINEQYGQVMQTDSSKKSKFGRSDNDWKRLVQEAWQEQAQLQVIELSPKQDCFQEDLVDDLLNEGDSPLLDFMLLFSLKPIFPNIKRITSWDLKRQTQLRQVLRQLSLQSRPQAERGSTEPMKKSQKEKALLKVAQLNFELGNLKQAICFASKAAQYTTDRNIAAYAHIIKLASYIERIIDEEDSRVKEYLLKQCSSYLADLPLSHFPHHRLHFLILELFISFFKESKSQVNYLIRSIQQVCGRTFLFLRHYTRLRMAAWQGLKMVVKLPEEEGGGLQRQIQMHLLQFLGFFANEEFARAEEQLRKGELMAENQTNFTKQLVLTLKVKMLKALGASPEYRKLLKAEAFFAWPAQIKFIVGYVKSKLVAGGSAVNALGKRKQGVANCVRQLEQIQELELPGEARLHLWQSIVKYAMAANEQETAQEFLVKMIRHSGQMKMYQKRAVYSLIRGQTTDIGQDQKIDEKNASEQRNEPYGETLLQLDRYLQAYLNSQKQEATPKQNKHKQVEQKYFYERLKQTMNQLSALNSPSDPDTSSSAIKIMQSFLTNQKLFFYSQSRCEILVLNNPLDETEELPKNIVFQDSPESLKVKSFDQTPVKEYQPPVPRQTPRGGLYLSFHDIKQDQALQQSTYLMFQDAKQYVDSFISQVEVDRSTPMAAMHSFARIRVTEEEEEEEKCHSSPQHLKQRTEDFCRRLETERALRLEPAIESGRIQLSLCSDRRRKLYAGEEEEEEEESFSSMGMHEEARLSLQEYHSQQMPQIVQFVDPIDEIGQSDASDQQSNSTVKDELDPALKKKIELISNTIFDKEVLLQLGQGCCQAQAFEYFGLQCLTLYLNEINTNQPEEKLSPKALKAHLYLAYLYSIIYSLESCSSLYLNQRELQTSGGQTVAYHFGHYKQNSLPPSMGSLEHFLSQKIQAKVIANDKWVLESYF